MTWLGDKFRDWLDGGKNKSPDNAKAEDAKKPPKKEGR